MKKEINMADALRRANGIMKNSETLRSKLMLQIAEVAPCEDSETVAIYALAKTLIDIVIVQMEAGSTGVIEKFFALLEAEVEAKVMEWK